MGEIKNFGDVIAYAKQNQNAQFSRKGWNGKNMYIQLQTPTEASKMTLPYFYMCTVQGDLVPWLASQTDILAEDWELVADSN